MRHLARIGGTADKVRITTKENLQTDGWGSYWDWMNSYPYANQKNATVKQNLGRTAALNVDTDGDGTLDTDYNGYTAKKLIPLSDKLNGMPVTGTVTYSVLPGVKDYEWSIADANPLDPTDKRPSPYVKAGLPSETLITFTGDSQKHPQVFTLDPVKANAFTSANKVKGGWSLAFNNIPEGQPIIINVAGSSSLDWTPGWRVYVNGKDYSTAINRRDASLFRYRSIASRIMWNLPNITSLTLESSPVNGFALWQNNKWNYGHIEGLTNNGVLFPGSILLPHGSMTDYADTNGRLLIGKNLILDIWEHHNTPWIGLPDTPQCFAVDGRTRVTLG